MTMKSEMPMNHSRIRQERSSADFQSAVSPNCIRQNYGPVPGVGPLRCDADYKSAIQQSTTLRYESRARALKLGGLRNALLGFRHSDFLGPWSLVLGPCHTTERAERRRVYVFSTPAGLVAQTVSLLCRRMPSCGSRTSLARGKPADTCRLTIGETADGQ